ncbi:hypothetical protein B0H21DRAFT_892803 [Amylocystis lapponica]|nr:hypothetical protein B0H21DRAFT_892803 [Amylocystis lapponica]
MALVMVTRKHTKRGKGKHAHRPLVRVFADGWGDDWVDVANQLCLALDLPDLTTHSGLKKVHTDLLSIRERLDETFTYAKRNGEVKVLGGVISIYAKLCIIDFILQDKLIRAGFLDRMVALSELPETRQIALRTLNAITLHSSKSFFKEIVKHMPTLTRLLKQSQDDVVTSSLIASIYAHSIQLTMRGDSLKYFDLPAITAAVLNSIRNPGLTHSMLDHVMFLVNRTIADLGTECKAIPSLTMFCVALLRSVDLRYRAAALRYLVLMNFTVTSEKPSDTDKKGRNHANVMAFNIAATLKKRDFPAELAKALDTVGRERSEMLATHRSSKTYLALHAVHAFKPDLVKLGRGLAVEILSSRFALPHLLCNCCGHPVPSNNPESDPDDILLKCANALRTHHQLDSSDLDYADILEWNHYNVRTREDARDYASGAVARNPECGYVYYAVAAYADSTESFRMARKGLRCQGLTPWLQVALRRAAVESAFWLSLIDNTGRTADMDECVAILLGAYEDAKVLVKLSPPDGVDRQKDLSMYILLALVIEGPKIDISSPEIQWAIQQCELNEKFMDFINQPFDVNTYSNEARWTVTRAMPEALGQWGTTIEHLNALPTEDRHDHLKLPESVCDGDSAALACWLSNFEEELDKKVTPSRARTALSCLVSTRTFPQIASLHTSCARGVSDPVQSSRNALGVGSRDTAIRNARGTIGRSTKMFASTPTIQGKSRQWCSWLCPLSHICPYPFFLSKHSISFELVLAFDADSILLHSNWYHLVHP